MTRFTRVKMKDSGREGSVAERLSSQFTVDYDDGSFGFLFYKDKGVEWEPLDEQKARSARLREISAKAQLDFAKEMADMVKWVKQFEQELVK